MTVDDDTEHNDPAGRAYWNRQYYDNMAFYFWEPQHIGRTRDPETRIRTEAEAVAKLKTLEVVLNHQMELFFRLAPDDFVCRLFQAAFGGDVEDRYRIVGREFHKAFAVAGLTQPDLLFQGEASTVAIELKLAAKTSLEQVIKYACLFSLMPPVSGMRGLLFMGPRNFARLWRERFADADAVRTALGAVAAEALSPRLRRFLNARETGLHQLLPGIRIGFMSYADLHEHLAAEARRGPHHQSWTRLLAGMMAELEERQLARSGLEALP